MSKIDPSLPHPLSAIFHPSPSSTEPPRIQSLLTSLSLEPHPEGGYFHETDRDPFLVPNPFKDSPAAANATATSTSSKDDNTRSASTSIYYYLTPKTPMGYFHRNKGRTIHTLHKGRGRYVIIHADEMSAQEGKARVETFVVGQDVAKGERLQWVVEGGKFKATFLLEDEDGKEGSREGLLISETVVPGFEFADHDFCTKEVFEELLTPEHQAELKWLLHPNSGSK